MLLYLRETLQMSCLVSSTYIIKKSFYVYITSAALDTERAGCHLAPRKYVPFKPVSMPTISGMPNSVMMQYCCTRSLEATREPV